MYPRVLKNESTTKPGMKISGFVVYNNTGSTPAMSTNLHDPGLVLECRFCFVKSGPEIAKLVKYKLWTELVY